MQYELLTRDNLSVIKSADVNLVQVLKNPQTAFEVASVCAALYKRISEKGHQFKIPSITDTIQIQCGNEKLTLHYEQDHGIEISTVVFVSIVVNKALIVENEKQTVDFDKILSPYMIA
ncbi:hypothetical protein FOD75_11015 (plasmid) [Limosilactobacillus reuteri]|uniref:Uncharacterized protein n=1 Tax=Limosilactobacillus reuteri TaxID=1598 RepID=A0A517D8E5_LIMRT|nr:hypothetical protein [Limosilactobacillus reuteri]QDR73619.1 hypothetical protein FOD75_11015 [Limosilactobacillus reuteri]